MCRIATVCLVATFWMTSVAKAEVRTRVVKAGQTSTITVHNSWDPKDCSPAVGIVKVLTKPQHGKLSNRQISMIIKGSRLGSVGSCLGKPTKGFEVLYTPASGFRGTDTFSIGITWQLMNRQEVDSYTVTVQ